MSFSSYIIIVDYFNEKHYSTDCAGLTAIMNIFLSKKYLSSEDQGSFIATVGFSPRVWEYGSVDGRHWIDDGEKSHQDFYRSEYRQLLINISS